MAQQFAQTTAVICGGSRGIGKETAKEIARLGGNVCLVARSLPTLEVAAQEVAAVTSQDHQFVETIACDTTDAQKLKPLLEAFVNRFGVPDYLINCVGMSEPGYVQDLTLEDFRRHMASNYYGQLVPILILLPHFIQARKGHIANVSSMMGYFAFMGYAAYAPPKFAIVGLSEALRHELKPYNIHCSVLYPPDTDTEMLRQELESRPEESTIIAGTVELMSAQEVAQDFVKGILNKQFTILTGEAGWVWRLQRFAPWLTRWILDRKYDQARQKTGLNH